MATIPIDCRNGTSRPVRMAAAMTSVSDSENQNLSHSPVSGSRAGTGDGFSADEIAQFERDGFFIARGLAGGDWATRMLQVTREHLERELPPSNSKPTSITPALRNRSISLAAARFADSNRLIHETLSSPNGSATYRWCDAFLSCSAPAL